MALTEQQLTMLSNGLDSSVVKQRQQGGRNLSYVEGHYAIRKANEIFGYDGWTRHTLEMRLVHNDVYEGRDARQGWIVAYAAQVQIMVYRDGQEPITTDGWGYGEGIDYNNPGQAHESAIKEAETDAMKRALIKWGDQFGLSLYGNSSARTHNNISSTPAPRPRPADIETLGKEGAALFREHCQQWELPQTFPAELFAFMQKCWEGVGKVADVPVADKQELYQWAEAQLGEVESPPPDLRERVLAAGRQLGLKPSRVSNDMTNKDEQELSRLLAEYRAAINAKDQDEGQQESLL